MHTRRPGDSPEVIAALDEAYDLLRAIGKRVLAKQARETAREAAERQVAPDQSPETIRSPTRGRKEGSAHASNTPKAAPRI